MTRELTGFSMVSLFMMMTGRAGGWGLTWTDNAAGGIESSSGHAADAVVSVPGTSYRVGC